MYDYAVAHGVPAKDMVRDYAGRRTYDTCYRAGAIFGVRQAILVTQRFHLYRAMYTCDSLGMDVVGLVADRRLYGERVLLLVPRRRGHPGGLVGRDDPSPGARAGGQDRPWTLEPVLFAAWRMGLAIAAPVGPIGVLCIRRTLAQGRAAGLLSGLGAATADALYGSVAAFGLTAVSGVLVAQRSLAGAGRRRVPLLPGRADLPGRICPAGIAGAPPGGLAGELRLHPGADPDQPDDHPELRGRLRRAWAWAAARTGPCDAALLVLGVFWVPRRGGWR